MALKIGTEPTMAELVSFIEDLDKRQKKIDDRLPADLAATLDRLRVAVEQSAESARQAERAGREAASAKLVASNISAQLASLQADLASLSDQLAPTLSDLCAKRKTANAWRTLWSVYRPRPRTVVWVGAAASAVAFAAANWGDVSGFVAFIWDSVS